MSTSAQEEEDDDEANMVFRDAYVNLFSRMTYWWFGKQVLQVGYKKPLELSDLGPMPKVCLLTSLHVRHATSSLFCWQKDSSDTAYKAIKSAWQKEVVCASYCGIVSFIH